MPIFKRESYNNRFDIIAHCANPNSRRATVGITFFRNDNQLEAEAAASAIQNAREKLQLCPPNCTYPCVLKNLAHANPETVLQLINSNPSQLTASVSV